MVYDCLIGSRSGADDPLLSNPMKTAFLLSDWGKPIESAVRSAAAVAVAVYVAGYVAGVWLHRLNNGLTAVVTGKPAPAPAPKIVQRCAVAAVPARAGLLPQEPMDRAVLAVRHGMAQAAAARYYGVSRSTLRRRLAR